MRKSFDFLKTLEEFKQLECDVGENTATTVPAAETSSANGGDQEPGNVQGSSREVHNRNVCTVQPLQVQPVQVQPVQGRPVQVQPVQVRHVQVRPVQVQPVQRDIIIQRFHYY